jgi:hypothetical protein
MEEMEETWKKNGRKYFFISATFKNDKKNGRNGRK